MLAMDEKKKNERALFRKLESRARLMDLFDAAMKSPLPDRKRKLQRLRMYLDEWRRHLAAYFPKLAGPGHSSWVGRKSDEIRTASEFLERSDRWAMEIVERAIEDLRKRQDGEAMRAALRVRVLNEAIPAHVFRHGQLQGISRYEVDVLADRAEDALVDIVEAYGLPL
jgi:hypothetical protein